MNKSQSLFVFCILATLNLSAVRKVNIVNQATTPVRVDLTIPGRTEAQIQLKAIQQARQFNPNAQALLLKAIANDSKEEIMRAIRIGADVNYVQGGMSPLLMAIALKKDKAFQFLIEQGAKPNEVMFKYAIKRGYIKIAYLLAKKIGLDVSAKYPYYEHSMTLLQNALGTNDYEVIIMLIKDGVHCDSDTIKRVYEIACGEKSMLLLQELSNKGYDLNLALTCGSIYYNQEALRWVLQRGGNPNYVFSNGTEGSFITPLFAAIMHGSLQSIEILLNAGADINQKGKPYISAKMQTPLAIAIESPSQDIIEFLIFHDAALE